MAILTAVLNTLIVVICLFLICLVLIQRGKGGGLAGAFGGMGGSSAFGTKAGDVFTRVTVGVAAVWIFLSMFLVILYNQGKQSAWGNEPSAVSKELTPKGTRAKAKATSTSAAAPASTSPASTPAPAGVPAAIPDAAPKTK